MNMDKPTVSSNVLLPPETVAADGSVRSGATAPLPPVADWERQYRLACDALWKLKREREILEVKIDTLKQVKATLLRRLKAAKSATGGNAETQRASGEGDAR